MIDTLMWTACILALLPLALICWNLVLYRPPPASIGFDRTVSVLIPSRNEAHNIGAALEAVLKSHYPRFEVLVLDDHSDDETAAIVADYAIRDSRVRPMRGQPLPARASGKPFACAQLAEAARGEILLFVDADVRLAPAAIGRIGAALAGGAIAQGSESDIGGPALSSGVPRQITVTWGEKLLVPLIHFMLLGYLPMAGMRLSRHESFGAACGQLVAVRRDAYFQAGGHRAILETFHDGLALARRFRACGFDTDLIDVTRLAECRMYERFGEVVAGFAKNAHEGLGSRTGIVPWSLILLGGHVLPIGALLWAIGEPDLMLPAALGVAGAYAARTLLAMKFAHDAWSVVLHPVAIATLVGIQWYALFRRAIGKPVGWKGRQQLAEAGPAGTGAPQSRRRRKPGRSGITRPG